MKKLFLLLCLAPLTAIGQKLWTLNDCIQYAKSNNLSIKESEIDLQAANINKIKAKMNFLPSVNGNVAYNFNTGKNINPVTNQYENTIFQSASGGIGASVSLFEGLQNWRKLKQAELNVIASHYKLDKMKDDIILMIIKAYGDVLSNKEQIKNLKTQLQISKENLERTRELIASGSLPKGDIYEAESQLLTQEQQIIATESALFIARMGLAQILLLKNYEDFDIDDAQFEQPSDKILTETPETIYQRAKETMSDVKIAENTVLLAKNALKIAQSSYSPRLSFQWGYNSRWSKNNNNNFLQSTTDFWQQINDNKGMNAGFSLNIPIFNGFAISNEVKTQRLNVMKAEFAKEQTELTTQKNIYQAYNDAANAKKLYEATEKTAQAKQQAFSYAQERHNVGLMNTFDFSQAKYQYENAQNDYVKAKYNYIFKIKVLEDYFGVR